MRCVGREIVLRVRLLAGRREGRKGGLYLARVILYGIHVESMESIGNSIWNPWNPSGIPYGIHGMRMEWSWTDQFHMDSTWIPQDSIWNAGISTLDSMEIPLESQRNNLIWLQKIVTTLRIEHQPPWSITWLTKWALFPLHYLTILR